MMSIFDLKKLVSNRNEVLLQVSQTDEEMNIPV